MRQELRGSIRRFVRQGAKIVAADGSALGTCLMLDVSGTGARLKTDAPGVLPDEFILLLSRDGRLRRQCSVAWRSETAIGVRFILERSIKRN